MAAALSAAAEQGAELRDAAGVAELLAEELERLQGAAAADSYAFATKARHSAEGWGWHPWTAGNLGLLLTRS